MIMDPTKIAPAPRKRSPMAVIAVVFVLIAGALLLPGVVLLGAGFLGGLGPAGVTGHTSPEAIIAGRPTPLLFEFYDGRNVAKRFTELSVHYRIEGEQTFRPVTGVQGKVWRSGTVYIMPVTFILPPMDATGSYVEYFLSDKADGYPNENHHNRIPLQRPFR